MNRPAGKIGVCTDSNSQIPQELIDRFDVEVVPITVVVDDHEYLEGVDLDADGFYALFTDEHTPTVSTSQPSPGQFALAYDALIERGCTKILSIHIASSMSGTMNSARLAARSLGVPVRLVDSGTASFGISCCVWAAGDALAAGATLDEAAAVAERLAPSIGNVFIAGALGMIRSSGRGGALDITDGRDSACGSGSIPVLALIAGRVEVLERVDTVVDAVNCMSAIAVRWDERLNVAVGLADWETAPIAHALAHAVGEAASVNEVITYRIGPSVGAHTGPGTAGCFMFASSLARSIPATS